MKLYELGAEADGIVNSSLCMHFFKQTTVCLFLYQMKMYKS
jgi:hypothetical protein